MRTVRLALWGLVLLAVAVVGGVYVGKTFLAPETLRADGGVAGAFLRSGYEKAGGPFTLLNTEGDTVTAADLRGKPMAIFFGFTHCPDVCPTHLLDAAGWLEALGKDADRLNVVFVSVDPERDTPDLLKRYVAAFDERIVGLTAPNEAIIAEVAERYRVVYEKVPFADGGYTMNHTTDTLLFDAQGQYVDFIPYLAPNVRQNEEIAREERGRSIALLKRLVNT